MSSFRSIRLSNVAPAGNYCDVSVEAQVCSDSPTTNIEGLSEKLRLCVRSTPRAKKQEKKSSVEEVDDEPVLKPTLRSVGLCFVKEEEKGVEKETTSEKRKANSGEPATKCLLLASTVWALDPNAAKIEMWVAESPADSAVSMDCDQDHTEEINNWKAHTSPKTLKLESVRLMIRHPIFFDMNDHFQHRNFLQQNLSGGIFQQPSDVMYTVIPFGTVPFGHLVEIKNVVGWTSTSSSGSGRTWGEEKHAEELKRIQSEAPHLLTNQKMAIQYKVQILKAIMPLFWNGLFTLCDSDNNQIVIVPNSKKRFCIDLTAKKTTALTAKERIAPTPVVISSEKTRDPPQQLLPHWRTTSRKKELRKKQAHDKAHDDGSASGNGCATVRWDRDRVMRRELPSLRLTINSQFGETLASIAEYHLAGRSSKKKKQRGKDSSLAGDSDDDEKEEEGGGSTWLVPSMIDAFIQLHKQQEKQVESMREGSTNETQEEELYRKQHQAAILRQEPVLMTWELWRVEQCRNDSELEDETEEEEEDIQQKVDRIDVLSEPEIRQLGSETESFQRFQKLLTDDVQSTAVVSDLKELGNKFYGEGYPVLAVKCYSGAIGAAVATQSVKMEVLFSNRAAALLTIASSKIEFSRPDKILFLKLALRDARTAAELKSDWFKAHLRCADALCKLAAENLNLKEGRVRARHLLEESLRSYRRSATCENGKENSAVVEGEKECTELLKDLSKATLVAAAAGFSIGSVYHDYTMATFERGQPGISFGNILTKLIGDTLSKCGYQLWYWGMKLGYMHDFEKHYGGVNLSREDFYKIWFSERSKLSCEKSKCSVGDPRSILKGGHGLVSWLGEDVGGKVE